MFIGNTIRIRIGQIKLVFDGSLTNLKLPRKQKFSRKNNYKLPAFYYALYFRPANRYGNAVILHPQFVAVLVRGVLFNRKTP